MACSVSRQSSRQGLNRFTMRARCRQPRMSTAQGAVKRHFDAHSRKVCADVSFSSNCCSAVELISFHFAGR
jgi:hypothetical protein